MSVKKLKQCRICQNAFQPPVFTLGSIPLPNALPNADQLQSACPSYPLDIHLCQRCGMVQLGHSVEAEAMFGQYTFFTGTSAPAVKHFEAMAKKLRETHLNEGDFVVEIGSNDGTLTGALAAQGLKALGVDGAKNVVAEARKNHAKAQFIDRFFSKKTAEEILKEHGPAQMIVGCNVFAHVDAIRDLFDGIDLLLHEEGCAVIEAPYLQDLIDGLCYDTIYHEHISYLSVTALQNLAAFYQMQIQSVERVPTHGGSIRVVIKRKEHARAEALVKTLLQKEKDNGCLDPQTWEQFNRRAYAQREELMKTIQDCMEEDGQRIVGYGAPAKASILMNYCRIGISHMEYCTDTTPAKIGKFIPGTEVPVVSVDQLHKDKARTALMHSWNYKDSILKNEADWLRKGGRFIVPFPQVKVLTARDL